jgi:transcriptional regulator with XRE-family HTH domain
MAQLISDSAALQTLITNVRDQRLVRNWSQAEMARRCGMSRAAYQNFEAGVGNLTLLNLTRLLGVLGFSARMAELVPPAMPVVMEAARPKRQRARRHPPQ